MGRPRQKLLVGSTLLMALAMALAAGCSSPPPEDPISARETAPADAGVPAAETKEATLATEKTDLYFRTFGLPHRPAVVFLHGGPGANSYGFEASAGQALADRGYYVVAYDQRGAARSPAGNVQDYSYRGATRDLDDLIRALGLDRPVLLAHSFGGSVALKYLESHPVGARAVILVGSPMSFPATYLTILDRAAMVYRDRWQLSEAEKMERLRARMFPNGLVPPYTYGGEDISSVAQAMVSAGLVFPSSPTLDALTLVAQMSLGPGGDWFSAVNGDVGMGFHENDRVGHMDFTPLLARFRDRVYGVYGDEDLIFSSRQLTSISSAISAEHFTLLRASSHFPFVDQRDAFVDAVARHLKAMK